MYDKCRRYDVDWNIILEHTNFSSLEPNESWTMQNCDKGWEYKTDVKSSIVIDVRKNIVFHLKAHFVFWFITKLSRDWLEKNKIKRIRKKTLIPFSHFFSYTCCSVRFGLRKGYLSNFRTRRAQPRWTRWCLFIWGVERSLWQKDFLFLVFSNFACWQFHNIS